MESLILASSSPRRREILEALGIDCTVLSPELDESVRDGLPTAKRVLALAEDKVRAALAILARGAEASRAAAPRLILCADTLVTILGRQDSEGEGGKTGHGIAEEVFGKARDRAEARYMISRLAGTEHCVRTGIALMDRGTGEMLTARSDSFVRFAAMSGDEIEAYLDTEEWIGVAGAYRVQGAAALFIERIEGSWSGIVGLPIRELYEILTKMRFKGLPCGKPLEG
jgi:septum formation protein